MCITRSLLVSPVWQGTKLTSAAQLYIYEDAAGNGDVVRMKNAVWVVLASALLWLISSLAHFGYWWRHRERRSRFTSRAKL